MKTQIFSKLLVFLIKKYRKLWLKFALVEVALNRLIRERELLRYQREEFVNDTKCLTN